MRRHLTSQGHRGDRPRGRLSTGDILSSVSESAALHRRARAEYKDPSMTYRYKAFISYSHAADGRAAPALQSALQRFAKPWYRLRALRVFRDETGLGVTPKLWGTIQRALEASEYFILLASPAAAQSRWVHQEIEFWLQHRSVETLLIVLTDGNIAWDAQAADFDWSRTDTLPRVLERRFPQEPKFLDLRWVRSDIDVSLRRPRFLDAVASLSASLRNVPLDDLIGEDIAQHRGTQRLVRWAVVTLAVLTVASLSAAYLANQARQLALRLEGEQLAKVRAEQQAAEGRARHAEAEQSAAGERERKAVASRQLAARATSLLDTNRELSTLVAVEAVELSPTAEAEAALRLPLVRPVAPMILRGPRRIVASVQWNRDGDRLLAMTDDNSVWIWPLGSPGPPVVLARQRLLDSSDGATAVFSPDGSTVLTAPYRDRTYLDPEGRANRARIWDARSGQLRRELAHQYLHAAAWSPHGRRIVTTSDDGSVVIWDTESGTRLVELKDETGLMGVEWSRDGKWFVTASEDGTARVRAQDGTTRAQLRVPSTRFLAGFSPDGRWIFTLGHDKIPRVWNWQDAPGSSAAELRGHDGGITTAGFSPDSRLFLTASTDRSARIWQIATGRTLHELAGHDDFVNEASWSPDGRWVVTAGGDGRSIVWEVATGRRLMELDGNRSVRTSAAWSPDGKRIASGLASGEVLVHLCEVCGASAELLTLARTRVTRSLTSDERARYLRDLVPP